mmetsp:Transcript_50755/g.162473  ORF Transcript_50755/g.162473 Transcript_50755/m.162473 type:complete len:243 (+) Transcript_50755:1680-2408(+)
MVLPWLLPPGGRVACHRGVVLKVVEQAGVHARQLPQHLCVAGGVLLGPRLGAQLHLVPERFWLSPTLRAPQAGEELSCALGEIEGHDPLLAGLVCDHPLELSTQQRRLLLPHVAWVLHTRLGGLARVPVGVLDIQLDRPAGGVGVPRMFPDPQQYEGVHPLWLVEVEVLVVDGLQGQQLLIPFLHSVGKALLFRLPLLLRLVLAHALGRQEATATTPHQLTTTPVCSEGKGAKGLRRRPAFM